MKSPFYIPNKICSIKDADGLMPEFRIITGNRTAGKTFSVKTMLIRRWLKSGKKRKFIVLVRFGYQLKNTATAFFKDIEEIKFPGHKMTEKEQIKNVYSSLYFDGEECGYCIVINAANTVKIHSPVFTDADFIFFDEFQSEDGKYCPKELQKFESIITSVGRGHGKQSRHIEVWMCANAVSIMNPYYVKFGIHKRLTMNTKFMRGRGWVLEQTWNENAAKEIRETGAYRAFEDDKHMAYVTGDQYLLDNYNFVENVKGDKEPVATLERNNVRYGIWKTQSGMYYVSHKHDPGCRLVMAVNLETHNASTLLVTKGRYISAFREIFDKGLVWFEDITCKNLFLDLIGLDVNK